MLRSKERLAEIILFLKSFFLGLFKCVYFWNLFKITDDDSVSKIDYPCYIGGASNGDLYTEYVPEITKDSTCLIIDQVNKMYRYMLCFDASEKMKFKSPSVMMYKVIPQLTGTIGEDCFTDVEHSLVSSDEDKALRKKIMKQWKKRNYV